MLSFSLFPAIAQFLSLIPSNSIPLIHLGNPLRLGSAPTIYSDSWPWKSFEEFEGYISDLDKYGLAEFVHLGVSIRKIARGFSDHHPGSKTRVRATLDLTESEAQAVGNGAIPIFKTRVEEELSKYVDLELIPIPCPEDQPEPELEPDTDADT